jgi:hypothetical protein
MGKSRHQESEAARPAEAPGEATLEARGEPELRAEECRHLREGIGKTDPSLTSSKGTVREATLGRKGSKHFVGINVLSAPIFCRRQYFLLCLG